MTESILSQFHLLRPAWLLALLPIVALIWLVLRNRKHSQNWRTVCDRQLLPFVLTQNANTRSNFMLWSLALTSVIAIIAAAGPSWQKLPQPVFQDRSALVIALDLSQSMDATDIKPSRLSRARLKLLDILRARTVGQTALLVYAADAFTVAPLTDDSDTIAHLVPTLTTELMPAQGSNTTIAVNKAINLLEQAGIKHGHILLVSDGISPDQLESLDDINNNRVRLSVLGTGTKQGAPIPLSGGFLQDSRGAIVIPKLEEQTLRKAAAAGGGLYRLMRNDDSDINELLQLFDNADVDMHTSNLDLTADTWRDEGYWLLLLIIPFAAAYARRGWLMSFLIAPLLLNVSYNNTALALDTDTLWQTYDQQAMQAFEQGDIEAAANTFEDMKWKASALYKQGEYQKSIEALDQLGQSSDSDTYYNKGNAQALLGKLREALQSYDAALSLNPDNEDALYNRQLVQNAIKQQQSQQNNQQQNQPQNQQGQQNANQDQSDSQQSGGEQSTGERQSESENAENANQQSSSDAGQNSTDNQPQDIDEEMSNSAQQQAEQSEDDETQQQAQGQQNQQQEQEANSTESVAKTTSDSDQANRDDLSEQARATEVWLQRIPDDPGGLMRRKFLYQYQQRDKKQSAQPW